MKIYFEDGKLLDTKNLPETPDYVIDAADGVTACMNTLDQIYSADRDAIVYTNSIIAFSNRYAWNEDKEVPEIYIRSGEHMEFTDITLLTRRILWEGLNLAKLYLGGEFQKGDMYMNQRKVSTTHATAEGVREVLESFKESFVKQQGEQKVCKEQVVATFHITNGRLVEDMQ